MFITQKRIAPRPTTLGSLPDGEPGTLATLRLMRDLIRRFKTDPIIRAQALTLVDGLPSKSYRAEVARIFSFVRDDIRYTRDVRGVETLQWPTVTMQDGHGDCDDKVMLLGALLEAVGHPTRLVAIALHGGPFSHVLLETRIGNQWAPLDATEPWRAGETHYQGVTSRYVMNV